MHKIERKKKHFERHVLIGVVAMGAPMAPIWEMHGNKGAMRLNWQNCSYQVQNKYWYLCKSSAH